MNCGWGNAPVKKIDNRERADIRYVQCARRRHPGDPRRRPRDRRCDATVRPEGPPEGLHLLSGRLPRDVLRAPALRLGLPQADHPRADVRTDQRRRLDHRPDPLRRHPPPGEGRVGCRGRARDPVVRLLLAGRAERAGPLALLAGPGLAARVDPRGDGGPVRGGGRLRLLRVLPVHVRVPRTERHRRRLHPDVLDREVGAVHLPPHRVVRAGEPASARDDRAVVRRDRPLRDVPRQVALRRGRGLRRRRAVHAAGPVHPDHVGDPGVGALRDQPLPREGRHHRPPRQRTDGRPGESPGPLERHRRNRDRRRRPRVRFLRSGRGRLRQSGSRRDR